MLSSVYGLNVRIPKREHINPQVGETSEQRTERLKRAWKAFSATHVVDERGIVRERRHPDKRSKKVRNRHRSNALRVFWGRFALLNTKQHKIDLLKELADLDFLSCGGSAAKERLASLRHRFNRTKNSYYSLKGPCKVCSADATVRHHIIQLQNGGSNTGLNLMRLCHGCHAEVHPWMKHV